MLSFKRNNKDLDDYLVRTEKGLHTILFANFSEERWESTKKKVLKT